MNIEQNKNGNQLTVALAGRLDTLTVSELASAMDEGLAGISDLTFDLSGLTYVSSAGLRELFRAKKHMDGVRGNMVIRGCNEDLMEIFEITGFIDLLNIES